jgi:two-component system sensor histidine kinase/response regulator
MQTSTSVLVVDDSPFAARALVHVIESRGIRARGASSLEEATRICTEHRPSLLVTDVCMPNIDLMALCRHFRASGGHLGAVLLFSAHSEKELADIITATGADAFMEKNRGAAAVAGKVEALLADVTARRQPRPRMPSVPG